MRFDHPRRVVVGAVCLVLSPWAAAAPGVSHPACEPSSEVERVLARFSVPAAEQARENRTWAEFARALEEAIANDPYDVHLHRRYQDLHRPELESLIERYRALAAERPSDPASLYLYGRILGLLDRVESESPLLEALRVDPHYPWAHFGLARVYEVARPDPSKAQMHLAAFIEQCPQSSAAMGRLGNIRDPAMAEAVAASLRSKIAATRDPSLLPQLRAIWSTEFKATPPAEHAAVRERVRRDLLLLREMKPDQPVLESLLEGYLLVGDDDGTTWAIQTLASGFPQSERARQVATQRFYERHHAPDDGDASLAAQAYHRDLAAATQRWIELWPDDPEVWLARFRALAGSADVAPEELLSAIDALREKSRARPGFRGEPPVPFEIARALVRRNLALDRVPALVDEGLRQIEAAQPRIMGTGPEAALVISQIDQTLAFQGWMGREALFDAYLKQGRIDDARSTLATMERVLQESSAGGAGGPDDHRFPHLSASRWARRAALARAEGRAVDALLYYQLAMSLDPLAPDAPRDAAAALWRELGAGEPALLAFTTDSEARPTPFGMPRALELPEFELQDLTGRAWRLSDLRGKVVLISIWATWCPPCLDELPWLQKLHDRFQGAPDLVVLTLNVDENPGLVEPFLRRGGYSFPVVFAFEYMRDLWGHQWTIPCSWIVDAGGTVRREQLGFDSGGDPWVASVERAMAQVMSSATD